MQGLPARHIFPGIAYAYGMGTLEKVLAGFLEGLPRAATYNPVLDKLEVLNGKLAEVVASHGVWSHRRFAGLPSEKRQGPWRDACRDRGGGTVEMTPGSVVRASRRMWSTGAAEQVSWTNLRQTVLSYRGRCLDRMGIPARLNARQSWASEACNQR